MTNDSPEFLHPDTIFGRIPTWPFTVGAILAVATVVGTAFGLAVYVALHLTIGWR